MASPARAARVLRASCPRPSLRCGLAFGSRRKAIVAFRSNDRKIDPSLDDIFRPARVLTPYAIAARYPDAIVKHALTLAKVDEFIALTDKCHEEILGRIHDEGPLL
jgi:hypothetical protein